MTQKIFDTDNEEDMALLWSILPDNATVIRNLHEDYGEYRIEGVIGESHIDSDLLAINWHDKTEITRPIQEATEADFGKLCKCWNGENSAICLLKGVDNDGYFVDDHCWCWQHCRRLTKKEIEELC